MVVSSLLPLLNPSHNLNHVGTRGVKKRNEEICPSTERERERTLSLFRFRGLHAHSRTLLVKSSSVSKSEAKSTNTTNGIIALL